MYLVQRGKEKVLFQSHSSAGKTEFAMEHGGKEGRAENAQILRSRKRGTRKREEGQWVCFVSLAKEICGWLDHWSKIGHDNEGKNTVSRSSSS